MCESVFDYACPKYNLYVRNRRLLERYNGLKLDWLRDSLFFIVLISALVIVFRFVIGISVVGGESMYPNLMDGDIVVYLRTGKDYRYGDVVSMRVPSGDYYIKRVIAQGGDTVDLADGSVIVNGQVLDEPWARGQTETETGTVIFPYAVRKGNVFVLGDNRTVSLDSRTFGEVNLRQIKGRIILVYSGGSLRRLMREAGGDS